MDFHDAAGIFPMLEGEEYDAFRQDIKEHGLKEPIVTFKGKIIDGRNRFKACRDLGIKPLYHEWDGEGSLVEYVISLNLHRRHLSTNQRAMLGARIKESLQAEARARMDDVVFAEPAKISRRPGEDRAPTSSERAAAVVKTSAFPVEKAAYVLEHGVPALVAAVRADQVAVHNAAEIAKLPADEQAAVVGAGPEAMLSRAQTMRAEKKNSGPKAGRKAVAAGGVPAVKKWLDARIEVLAKSREEYAGARFEEATAIRAGLCEV